MRHLTTTCQDPIQPPKQLSAANVFANFMPELGALSEDTEIVMIDLIHLQTHRTTSSLAVKKGWRTADPAEERQRAS